MTVKGPDAMKRQGISWGVSSAGNLPGYATLEDMKRVHGGSVTVIALEKKEVSAKRIVLNESFCHMYYWDR